MTDAPLPDDLDALLDVIAREPDLDRAYAAAKAATARLAPWPDGQLKDYDDLSADQRRLARALADRDGVKLWGCGVPASRRLLRRWIGDEPASPLDRRFDATVDGERVRWPLWRLWTRADEDELERNQGVPRVAAEALTPAELIEAAAEIVLEPYDFVGSPLEDRLMEALDAHAAEAIAWAEPFADLLVTIRSPDAPVSRPGAEGYEGLGIYDWDTLGVLALLPIVRARGALDPRWDVIAPFTGPTGFVREVLLAMSPERREAFVYRRLTTDWGPSGERALNGFETGLSLLDLAPSERVARVLARKLSNNRSHFKRRMDRIQPRLDAVAAEHPAVAAGLDLRRRAAKTTRGA
ncbi:MAG: hypothetical protein R3A52_15660 [Polyangiales bacterium]